MTLINYSYGNNSKLLSRYKSNDNILIVKLDQFNLDRYKIIDLILSKFIVKKPLTDYQKVRAIEINTDNLEAEFLESCPNVYNKLESFNTGYLYTQLERVIENKGSSIRELPYYTGTYNMFNKKIPNSKLFRFFCKKLNTNNYMKLLFNYNNISSNSKKRLYLIKCLFKTILKLKI